MSHEEASPGNTQNTPDESLIHRLQRGNWVVPQNQSTTALEIGDRYLPRILNGETSWRELSQMQASNEQLGRLERTAKVAHAQYDISEIADQKVNKETLTTLMQESLRRIQGAANLYALSVFNEESLSPDELAEAREYIRALNEESDEEELASLTQPCEILFRPTANGLPRPEAAAFVELWQATASAARNQHAKSIATDFRNHVASEARSAPDSEEAQMHTENARTSFMSIADYVISQAQATLPSIAANTGFDIPADVAQEVLEIVIA